MDSLTNNFIISDFKPSNYFNIFDHEILNSDTFKKFSIDSITSSNIENFINYQKVDKKINNYFFNVKLKEGDLYILKTFDNEKCICKYFKNNEFEINNYNKQLKIINITKNIPNFTKEWNIFNKNNQDNVKVVDIILTQPNMETFNKKKDYNNNSKNSNKFSFWDCYM